MRALMAMAATLAFVCQGGAMNAQTSKFCSKNTVQSHLSRFRSYLIPSRDSRVSLSNLASRVSRVHQGYIGREASLREVYRNRAAKSSDEGSGEGLVAAQELLEWLQRSYGGNEEIGQSDDVPVDADIEVRRQEQGLRGVFAKKAIMKGDVILRVPLSLGIFETDRQETELDATEPSYWTGKLACRMMQAMFGPASAESKHWDLWKRSLPQEVILPATHYSDEDIFLAESPELIAEYDHLRSITSRIRQALTMASTRNDKGPLKKILGAEIAQENLVDMPLNGQDSKMHGGLDWALNIASSRSLDDPDAGHFLVPGIDLFNHAYAPVANAKLEKEIGMFVNEPKKGIVRLIAERDIAEGEEITFTYSRLPNEPFLLYYGFVPENNPFDSVVLYDGIRSVLQHVTGDRELGQQLEDEAVKRILFGLSRPDGGGEVYDEDIKLEPHYDRLGMNRGGVDGRLIGVMLASIQVLDSKARISEFLLERVRERAQSFSTSIGEDEVELRSLEAGSPQSQALRLRLDKKVICQSALSALEDMEAANKAKDESTDAAVTGKDEEELFLD